MQGLKFRYTYKRKEDGKIFQEIVPIECLEGRGDKPLALDLKNPYWEIIGRDSYTFFNAKDGREIFENDILKCKCTKGNPNADWWSNDSKVEEFYRNNLVEWYQSFSKYGYRLRDFKGHTMMVNKNALNKMEVEVVGNKWINPELLKLSEVKNE